MKAVPPPLPALSLSFTHSHLTLCWHCLWPAFAVDNIYVDFFLCSALTCSILCCLFMFRCQSVAFFLCKYAKFSSAVLVHPVLLLLLCEGSILLSYLFIEPPTAANATNFFGDEHFAHLPTLCAIFAALLFIFAA